MRSGGFRSTKFQFSTKVQLQYKAPSLHVSPPDVKPVLAVLIYLFIYLFIYLKI